MTEDKQRHLSVVPEPTEPTEPVECRWADGEHGSCGGPSNGRECWDHRYVGREDRRW